MRRLPLLAAALAFVPALADAQAPAGADKVIDVRATRPPAGNSFEALWSTYRNAELKGDTETAANAMREIRRLRVERNVRSLESLALARVADGVEVLKKGQISDAEARFRDAVALDPHLPDARFALATAAMKRGPIGILQAARETVGGAAARLATARGRLAAGSLGIAAALLTAFLTLVVFGLVMLLRYATLLVHDLEEDFGGGRRAMAIGIGVLLLFLPAVAFQGWGWLPLWWLGVLFVYFSIVERVVAVLAILATIVVGPLVARLDARFITQENPLFRASMLAVEGEPDARAMADLEDASRAQPDDRDLAYLLAIQYKKAGRYDDAAAVYRDILRAAPSDAVALNNLANIEFTRAEFPAAIARYKQGIESSPAPEVAATFYYNLSLAHLQRFEYQPAQEAKSQADRVASGLIKSYDASWKYDNASYAVVDLGPSAEDVWAKFAGQRQGARLKNVTGRGEKASIETGRALFNRFTAFPLFFAAAVVGVRKWRGPRAFTTRCLKCGTPFCRRCHLGASASGLCSQCHHLFVVRDGVSGPARNQKLLEVQKEDERRERVFRALSLLTPGSGHLFAQKTVPGLVFVLLWAAILAGAVLAARVLPFTEAASIVARPWGLGFAGLVLVIVYVMANRGRPDFDFAVPTRRPPSQPARRKAA